MTTYHSKFPADVVEQIRRLLFNYDLLIARLDAEIKLRKEQMKLYEADNMQAFINAKIEKENFEVFMYRVRKQKKDLLSKVNLVAKKYQGDYAQIFTWFFFEKKTIAEISELTGFTHKKTSLIIKRMREDIITVYKKKRA